MNFLALPFLSLLLMATAQRADNPLAGHDLYVTSSFRTNIRRTLQLEDTENRQILEKVASVSTAFWMSQRIPETDPSDPTNLNTLLGVLTDAASKSPVPLVTAVVYNLPNRDCDAGASAGEICCLKRANGSCNFEDSRECNGGLSEYRTAYIDVIAETVNKFCGIVPMAFVIEPDSLGNLITNLDNPRCNATGTRLSYHHGIIYAVEKLYATCPSAALYIDAAHGRWLGWEDYARKFVDQIDAMKIQEKIRGFATNVANYNQLGVTCPSVGFCFDVANADHECCQIDPCEVALAKNPGHTEHNYVAHLRAEVMEVMPSFQPHFLIDTSRNSVRNALTYCKTWCNPRDTGMGTLPTSDTAHPQWIDAYLWIKVPGEADGCSAILPNGEKCNRFDEACERPGSISTKEGEPKAPQAGAWFLFLIRQQAKRAALNKM